jgi:hypothetical protein
LSNAAENNHFEIVQYMLERGATNYNELTTNQLHDLTLYHNLSTSKLQTINVQLYSEIQVTITQIINVVTQLLCIRQLSDIVKKYVIEM